MMTPESSWNITMSSTTKPWIETAQPYYASEPPMNDLKHRFFMINDVMMMIDDE
jgi:hypothetical protein